MLAHERMLLAATFLTTAVPTAHAANFQTLYSFTGGSDGFAPRGNLIDVGGTLYGTTAFGGAGSGGAVYALTLGGTVTAVYPFKKNVGLKSGLIESGGDLYGTTSSGGTTGNGSVYKLTASGTLKTVYSFPGGADGSGPGGLTDLGGAFYGITGSGGAYGYGTVFRLTKSGVETVLYSFGADEQGPTSSLVLLNGTLYGTTGSTAYSMTADGMKTTLYQFTGQQGTSDGAEPGGDLLVLNGNLYGTTWYGGGSSNCKHGCGTVYSLTPAGQETILYRFTGLENGVQPSAGVINIGNVLYGTTAFGGSGCGKKGCGTIFSLSADGTQQVVYSFKGRQDGKFPSGSLLDVGSILYQPS